jgi:hypothetical protein
MKAIPVVTCAVILCVSTIALSQSEMHKQDGQKSDAQPSPTQLAFAQLKTLAGNWKGEAGTATQPRTVIGAVHVTLRVTSGGDAIMHEMVPEGRSDDPTHGDDDPITMLYIDSDRLLLTHYCDSGKNRPRMVGKASPDGKKVEFDFLDLSGETKFGHMNNAAFTFVDADHHSEDWTYMTPAGKTRQAHIELVRAK